MSFAAEGASGAKCVWGYRGSRSKLSRGKCSREEEKAPGGESGEGEVLEVPEWPGQWRRQELPETGKKTSLGRMRARGAPLGWPEVACVLGGVRGPLFIARPSRFAAAGDKNGGEPPLYAAGRCGGGWLAPGANDDHYTVERGELARCGGLGGAALGGGGCGRGHAAKRL